MLITAFLAALVALVLTAIGIPRFIMFFHKKKLGGQPTLEEVKQHASKSGTPTMGGLVFVVAALIVSAVFALIFAQFTPMFITAWWVLAMYSLIGFLDDFMKIFSQKNDGGLKASHKLLAQIATGIVSYLILMQVDSTNVLNILGWKIDLGWFFAVFIIFWLVGWSNAVNLTDGIDGLASITVAISLSAYAVIAAAQGRYDVLLIILSVIGGLIAFFFFNHKPAKIFMGDVGSLGLGGFIAIVSILLHVEWTLLLIGFIYILETVSVMMQVSYFKVTHGKRIFRMTPIHHHFELGGFSGKGKGWSEWKIDIVFWCVTALLSILALVIYFNI
ncbi:phospho-N-acetylmuramoyl-pentapeptide-transferase [Lactococcus petauri]|uniref:phospho-N-acetylmuramoyl-pentapeptide- transferase n=1 Tax=Lactococcus petauri TaxID=1940789 RepID=UPI0013FDE82D|nr:phospho-N-acetylmuramoyl-pentapeptide-transferase [Lactococcus petauri]NHI66330.1 phospho-N-acetylmuramoyl-pentapeptide-transferase [Lactococcus petauri]